jgi:hypothetical protein
MGGYILLQSRVLHRLINAYPTLTVLDLRVMCAMLSSAYGGSLGSPERVREIINSGRSPTHKLSSNVIQPMCDRVLGVMLHGQAADMPYSRHHRLGPRRELRTLARKGTRHEILLVLLAILLAKHRLKYIFPLNLRRIARRCNVRRATLVTACRALVQKQIFIPIKTSFKARREHGNQYAFNSNTVLDSASNMMVYRKIKQR